MLEIPGARDVGQATRVAVLSGSPAPDSRTWSLTTAVGRRLEAEAADVRLIDLRALPPADLLYGPGERGAVRAALDAVAWAHGVVVATPVHHAAYSGMLKAFLDLLPQAGLAGKVALPLAVGGSTAHVLTIDYALRPVLVSLGAAHVTRGQFLLCTEIERAADGTSRLEWEAERRLDGVVREFVTGLRLHAREGGGIPVVTVAPALAGES
jgi:FMN reductase